MSGMKEIDYGPLTRLIGTWQGDKGLDIAPEPVGTENNPYYEAITFSAIGDVTNADSQTLAVVHYRQIVQRKSDDTIFHDQTGYWMWDADAEVIIHSLTIPRAVCVLAGGCHDGKSEDDGRIILDVTAGVDDKDWQIIQSPFMRNNARTTGFHQRMTVGDGKMSYVQTIVLDIYGRVFEHTDQNELIRQ